MFLLGKDNSKKYLFIIGSIRVLDEFSGEIIHEIYVNDNKYYIKRAILSYNNLIKLKSLFTDLWPAPCNKSKSFGAGDRLGLVTASHIKAFKDRDIFPILAQQSVREISRTQRKWNDVINNALWGYFETGLTFSFGADADHVKKTSDLKEAVNAGFTMFTVDPSDYIEEVSTMERSEITRKYNSIAGISNLEKKYLGRSLILGDKEYLIEQNILITIVVKFKRALERVLNLYSFLKEYKREDFDFEVSMDEIEEPITPLEHYFISEELLSSGVDFQNLALRFIGRWEKAIDYIGDIELFEEQLKEHVQVLKTFGGYRLSLHSGSEKFSTYKPFSEITEGNFHIKTAGTSWLEALRALAVNSPLLFRDIFSFALKGFKKERKSYHLTTDAEKIPDTSNTADEKLVGYLDMAESRQVLHVAFGSILTSKDKEKRYLFREKIYEELIKNEDIHYKYVTANINKHLNLLNN